MGVEFDEAYGPRFRESGDGKEIVPYQEDFYALKEIKDLAPDEVVWIAMMFALIVDKFWKQGFKTEVLSYTGEMIRVEDRLLAASRSANLPVATYRPIVAPALDVADVRDDAVGDAVGRKPTGHNRWMEERYADVADPSLLNLVQRPRGAERLYISRSSNDVVPSRDRPGFLQAEGRHYEVHALDPTGFGTAEDLLADRKFLARYNLAQQVQRAADAEFEATKDEILAWYKKRIANNAPTLLKAIARGRFEAPVLKDQVSAFRVAPLEATSGNILQIKDLAEMDWADKHMGGVNLYRGFAKRNGYLCFLNGTKATYRAMFRPQTAGALAQLCGCAIEDLPEVLRHWTSAEPYVGNPLLNRIDPMEWAVHNPWRRLDFDVAVFLSKRGLAKLKAAASKEETPFAE